MVCNVLPQALEDGADVVSDGELVVELAGGTRVLHICRERTCLFNAIPPKKLKCIVPTFKKELIPT